MNELLQTVDELRRMSTAELVQVAEDGLMERLREQARETRERYGPLSPANLGTVLDDRNCVRYPTRLVLEYGEMAAHQFAQPAPDIRNPGGVMLYVRPILGRRPDLLAAAVSYMIPVINYGEVINDEHCIAYGADLLGIPPESYYRRICDVAEFSGAPERYPESHQTESPTVSACGSGGCGCH